MNMSAPPNQPALTEYVNKSKYEFNSPSRLPPVGCKLVIKVGDSEMLATRTCYIAVNSSKNFKFETSLEYKLDSTGEIILGRFFWSYP